jgi:hypothetical protein
MAYTSKLPKSYVWWIERERLALGEYTKGGDVDCMTSPTAESAGFKIRMLVTRRANDFGAVMTATSEIPPQFHEALAYKAISMGYLQGEGANPQLAQYFDQLYQQQVKKAKKYAKNRHLSTGFIRPQDF